MQKQNVYEEYAVLSSQIDALTAKKDELKVQIIEDMIARNKKREPIAVGDFTLVEKKKWTYTSKVAELQEAYKARMATEEGTGEATYVINPFIMFKPIKL